MLDSISFLSLGAAAVYVFVAMFAVAAAYASRRWNQERWHLLCWLCLAVLFFLLAASRVLDSENALRELLKEAFTSKAAYESRQDFQRPFVAAAFVIVCAAGCWWVYWLAQSIRRRRDLSVAAAVTGGLGMIFLIALRVISLHLIDKALYGPFKLNWVVDIGLSCLVIATAFFYVNILRSRG